MIEVWTKKRCFLASKINLKIFTIEYFLKFIQQELYFVLNNFFFFLQFLDDFLVHT